MNLLFMSNGLPPYGIPRNGLVSIIDPWRDTYGRNILPSGAENFVGWIAFSGATVTVTPNQPDPDGGNNAYRIQSSGGSSFWKYYNAVGPAPAPHDSVSSIYAKLLTGNCIMQDSDNSDVGTSYVLTTKWAKATSFVKNSTGTSYSLGFRTNNIADNLDILVYQPQVNLGQLYPYAPPSGLPQSLTDYSGHGNTFQLGSTAGSDTNDPAWSGVALVGGGVDDYAVASFASAAYRISIVDSGSGYTFVNEVPAYLDLFKTGASTYLNGKIGPTAYYNRVLTASEIAQAKAGLKRYMASKGVTVV